TDESSQRWYLEMLQRHASAVGWALWYLIRREPTRELVGVAGFKGRPADGSCEIGYSLLPSFHGSGYATEASRELIRWAFSHRDVERATGETLTARSDRLNTRDGEVRNAVHWRREPRRGTTHRPLRGGSRRVPPIADVPKQPLIHSPIPSRDSGRVRGNKGGRMRSRRDCGVSSLRPPR